MTRSGRGLGAGAAVAVAFGLVGLIAGPVAAQTTVEGILVDGTAGGPGRADRVSVIRLGRGMDEVAHATDVVQSFRLELDGSGPYLVQALLDGVRYSARVSPSEATARVELTLFDTITDVSLLAVTVPHFIIIVDGARLHVSRVFEIDNRSSPPRAVVGEPGAFRFDLPEDAELLSAAVTSTAMPLRQEPVETVDGVGQTIAFAMKPGRTRYEIEYALAYPGAVELRETLHHPTAGMNVVIVPADLEVEIDGLEALGRDEREGVSFLRFAGRDLAAGTVVSLRLSGAAQAPPAPGSARAPAAGAAPAEGEIKAVENRVSRGWHAYAIIAAVSAILASALVVVVRRPPPAAGEGPGARRPVLSEKAERLLDEIARLDLDHERGRVVGDEHDRRRSELKSALTSELARGRRRTPAR